MQSHSRFVVALGLSRRDASDPFAKSWLCKRLSLYRGRFHRPDGSGRPLAYHETSSLTYGNTSTLNTTSMEEASTTEIAEGKEKGPKAQQGYVVPSKPILIVLVGLIGSGKVKRSLSLPEHD